MVDGNVVTSTRGDYFYIQNSDAIYNALQMNGFNSNIQNISSAVNIYNSDFQSDDIIWAKTYGDEASELSNDLITLGNNELVLLVTSFSNSNGSSDILIKKLDQNGNEIWSLNFGGEKRETGSSLLFHKEFIYASGTTTSFGNGKKDFVIMKISQEGEIIWTKFFGGQNDDICKKIIALPNDNLVMCGETFSSGNGEDDFLIIKIDEDGNLISEKTIGYSESDMVFDLIKSSDDNLIFLGASGHFSDKRDICFKIYNLN
jgi:hypothetical protein